jgi:hypothetical protein
MPEQAAAWLKLNAKACKVISYAAIQYIYEAGLYLKASFKTT